MCPCFWRRDCLFADTCSAFYPFASWWLSASISVFQQVSLKPVCGSQQKPAVLEDPQALVGCVNCVNVFKAKGLMKEPPNFCSVY